MHVKLGATKLLSEVADAQRIDSLNEQRMKQVECLARRQDVPFGRPDSVVGFGVSLRTLGNEALHNNFLKITLSGNTLRFRDQGHYWYFDGRKIIANRT